MCMLTVYPMPGLMDGPGIERLSNGANLNPHGSGWAVISDGRILTGKSMDGETAIEGFADAYDRATGPALFHSRWATHGSKTTPNVHPFPVKRVGGMVVAHNGVLPTDAWPDLHDDRSDTRFFADEILPDRFRRLDSPKVRDYLDKWLAGNKIAVLTVNRKYRRSLYLFGMELGNWVDGVWYSNHDHEGVSHKYAGLFSKRPWDHADNDCFWCHSWGAINEWGICETCGTCQDCFEPVEKCDCFTGSSPTVIGTVKGDDSATLYGDGEPSIYHGIPDDVLRGLGVNAEGIVDSMVG